MSQRPAGLDRALRRALPGDRSAVLATPSLHVQENDTGPDDCNHAQFGVFILAARAFDRRGEIEGVHILDLAPTLLDLAGSRIPESMQGRPLTRGV